MTLPFASMGFGFIAGILSTLSPCVLPLLPLVLGPALAVHRLGVPALVAGLVLSFASIGLFVATMGFAIGLDGDVFRNISAVLLAGLGVLLLSGALQQRFAMVTGGVSNAGSRLIARVTPTGVKGQFAVGVLLGAVWSPCVGPTLGAASVLAAQGHDLVSVAAVMVAFGLGTSVPLLIVGSLSRTAMMRWRGKMMNAGKAGKLLLGGSAVTVAVLILTGADHALEAALVAASPAWLTDLTTRF
ncbi:cytochrome c-type biogenesis protein [Bradyrhizobium sp. USDA 4524]|nr:cytochrome c biogenesis protein CcdA [Bradyrhizobium sp. USDA 4538]MCP1900719.1 cytochrome c biogenesis protein CcdA [Bradyrhizobium sp. USDA 4537]MCP1993625.1 cytochrome c biogenesis protein CcdA [Bradyrhizobium sp. USDA 4539]